MFFGRFLIAAAAVLWAGSALAQTPQQANVVANCGTPNSTYSANGTKPVTQDTSGTLCVQTAGGSVVVIPSSSATAGIAPTVSGSLEASHVFKAAAGNLYSVYASNLTGGASSYLMVFDATSAPADGAVTPKVCVPFGSLGSASASYVGMPPANFLTGITAVVSSATTCFTKTTGVTTAFISGLVK